ncbi:MAG: ankyrin repeat domain-containing protein [Gemmatimonadota bacterium]|nr:MAG: ankyrin repeat domain-containing protein [Gemmatimonadota bacterium]
MYKSVAIIAFAASALLGAAPVRAQDGHVAARAGDLATLEALLEQDPEQVSTVDENGRTPLDFAAGFGQEEAVRLLLQRGADINAADAAGMSAVDFAFFTERGSATARLTRLLVSEGAEFDANATLFGRARRLDLVISPGNIELTRFLVEQGADVNAIAYVLAPLESAAARGHLEIAEFLLEHGADVDLRGNDGNPPLRWAVERGHTDVVNLLLKHGAALDFREELYGRDLLHIAALNGHLDIVRSLVSHDVELNGRDDTGQTPLQLAAKYGHQRVADYLIEGGAVRPGNLEENYGLSPYLTRSMAPGEAVAWYLNHRGWAVRTQNHMLVFDAEEFGVKRPTQPSLANGFITPAEIGRLDVISFYTTFHASPGELAYVHEIEDSLASVTYVHNAKESWRGSERVVYVTPGEGCTIDDMGLVTIEVTQEMTSLGYLCKLDGLVIYYAGFRAENLDRFKQDLEFLAQHTDRIDIAFLPVAFSEGEGETDFRYFLERFRPRAVGLVDPSRREHMFGEVATTIAEWGIDAAVFAAANPGDAFVLERK